MRALWRLFDGRDRRRMYFLAAAMFIGGLLDVLGVGLVIPLITSVDRPYSTYALPVIGPVLLDLSNGDSGRLALIVGIGIAVLFLAKNLYLAWQLHAVFGFLADKGARMARDLLEAYMRAPYEFHLRHNSAELIRNTSNETYSVFNGVLLQMAIAAREGLLAAGLIGLVAAVQVASQSLSLIVFALAVLIGVVALVTLRAAQGRLKRAGDARVQTRVGMLRSVTDAVNAVDEIKIAGTERAWVDRFYGHSRGFTAANRESQLFREYPRLVLEVAAVVVLAAALVSVAVTPGSLLLNLPELALLGVAAAKFAPAASRVAAAVNQIRYNWPAVHVVAGQLEEARNSAWIHTSKYGMSPSATETASTC